MIYIPFIIINFIFANLSLDLIAENFDKPILIKFNSDFNEAIYVVEQNGIIKKIEKGVVIKILDITDRVHNPLFPGDEMGLLGLAFDPNFPSASYLYVNYNDKNDNTIISRFPLKNNIVDKSLENIIMKFKQPYSNHNGGCIEFGPDNYLYISVGDGGSAGDPENRAQDLTNYFGSILRISINDDGSYLIPEDNPFYGNKEYKQEIWSYGLRNVWRFSFDMMTGDLYMGDVGQNSWEEINFDLFPFKDGNNYGWNIMEASKCFPESSDCDSSNLVMPIFEYPNDAKYVRTLLGIKQNAMHGCSITAGYVYRGEIKNLYGRYFFGDYCTGKIWSLIYKNGVVTDIQEHTEVLLSSINKKKFYLSSFGQDKNGELYLVDYSGSIYKLISN